MNQNPLVWIIDDDDISKYIIRKNLQQLSITNVVEFSDSLEPLKGITKNIDSVDKLPDIILLDLNMPILDGFEFMEEFKILNKEIAKEIHIYMLTSSLSSNDLVRANSYPEISEYLIKPIAFQSLETIVKNILQN
ncbi:response regulator [Maribacter hydrothermalis]|uniref:Response regulatory domain-containing protein n=1 Tax=Maribacter hydrothermalis TaxID=1836467 RepID=A0A1B7Z1M9_9FLAO|nr:response regulator [Maribacter hydrothermalis]APQ18285.1 hypothetical protein BTR34_13525 [Maribacter hydrothermalis]OBR36631.1 hypothetical protein A9200_09415 [Maribacter hydrothermalis]